MRRIASAFAGSAGVLLVLLFASTVQAQSTIIGTVQDASGGVLPGVSVEAASDAIIEGTKTTVTDQTGRYRITDLRPGTYNITFTLSGFQTLKRSDVSLPSEFTATVDGELRVGQLTEVVNVSVPVTTVDTQSAVVITRFSRETIDNLPTGQNIWEIGQLVAGIQLSNPTVGGSGGATQTYMSVRGMSSAQNVVLVDGLTVSGLEANGSVQNYFNNANSQEVTYQTSAINADRSGGGVTVNMIPREGGNRFSGDGNFNYRPGSWVGDNLSDRLKSLGSTSTSSLEYLSDVTVSQGGPLLRDKLWFFSSFHQFNTRDLVANTVFDDGSQGSDGQKITQGSVRLTTQLSAKNKFSGFYEKIDKVRTNEMGAFDDPETASTRWSSPNYSTGTFKFTSTMTSRLLLEAGYSFNREFRNEFGQEGVIRDANTPEWLASAARTSQQGGYLTGAPSTASQTWPARDNLQASLSYISARHNIKAGIQYQWGSNFHNTIANADLSQRYEGVGSIVNNQVVLGRPVDVIIRNTPVQSRDRLVRDLGLYAMDTWQMDRLTLGYGLRWENIVAQNDGYDVPAGRFVPARSIPETKNVPNWKDIAPRFTAAYDLFGNAKTALKYSINRYNRAAATTLAFTFNPLTSTTRALPWTDLNNNDIAEVLPPYDASGNFTPCAYGTAGCEIDVSTLQSANGSRFGMPGEIPAYESYQRTWNLEQQVQLQHELTRRVSLTGSWTRGYDYDLTKIVNRYRQEGDYVPQTIFNPITGDPITIYSIKDAATRTRLAQGGANLTYNDPDRRNIFNEFALQFRLTPYNGAMIFGGFTSTRELERDCASARPELVINPNEVRFCDEFNLPDGMGIPFAHDFRLSGTFPLRWQGIMLGITYLNNDEGSLNSTYTLTHTPAASITRYPDGAANSARRISGQPAPPCPTHAGCVPGGLVLNNFIAPANTTTFTVPLQPDGNLRWERLYQTDIKVSKTMNFGRTQVIPTLNVYNLFNSDHINSYSSLAYASVTGNYLIPNTILVGRIIGIAAQVRW